IDELLQRYAMLQSERDRDREAVRHAAEGGPFLVHVEEDLAERAVLVLSGAEVDLVVADARLLRVAGPPIGQPPALADVTVNDFLGDAHRLRSGLFGLPLHSSRRLDRGVGDAIEWLAEL